MMRRLPRRLRLPALGLLALVLTGSAALAERGLRQLDGFQVRRVDVIGTRFLEPYAVVQAAGLDTLSSVFDDADAWRAGVLTLPLVDDAVVRRRLPGTVEIVVREAQPVALVAGESLEAVDARGRLLPLDLAGAGLDLPLLSGVALRDGRLSAADGGLQALETLLSLRSEAPELAERVSQVQREGAQLRVVFRDEAAEALLPLDATGVQMRQLRLAFADLVSRGELPRVRRIDLRFRDQVVVSFLSSPVS